MHCVTISNVETFAARDGEHLLDAALRPSRLSWTTAAAPAAAVSETNFLKLAVTMTLFSTMLLALLVVARVLWRRSMNPGGLALRRARLLDELRA